MSVRSRTGPSPPTGDDPANADAQEQHEALTAAPTRKAESISSISACRSWRPRTRRDLHDVVADLADFVLTAERVTFRVAKISRSGLVRAPTLLELLARSDDPVMHGVDVFDTWVRRLPDSLTTADHPHDPIEEIADPTGSTPHVFAAAVDLMHQQ